MVFDKLFGRISSLGSDVTSFVKLEYSKDGKKDEEKTNISNLDIKDTEFYTPSLNINGASRPEIPLIGIGGAGLRLLNKIVSRVTSYQAEYPTMGIDTDADDLERYDNITHKYHIPGTRGGTANQYKVASQRVKQVQPTLNEEIKSYIEALNVTHKHEIVFLLFGSGGTGVGASIEIAKILVEMGKRPVPIILLPAKEEMTRIKFNAAAALYNFSLAPRDRCLNLVTICIDNDMFLSRNSKKHYSSVISASNERIAATLGDIIVTTQLESHAYSVDLNEFLEIFRDIKGLATLQYLQVEKFGATLERVYDDNLSNSLSISCDVFSSTRSYFYLSSNEKKISAENYRSLLRKFDNSDVFNKFYEVDEKEEFYAIRAIYTGISTPEYIEHLMRVAEDARVELLTREVDNSKSGKANPKIDKLGDGEEIDVKTGQELSNTRNSGDQ